MTRVIRRGANAVKIPRTASAVPSEHEEQAALMALCAAYAERYPVLDLLFAIPNGGHRSKRTAARMRLEGVKAGIPDLFLPVPHGAEHGLWIEMKRRNASPSAVKSSQNEWHRRLWAQGYAVHVCRGADEAWAVLCAYLELPARLVGRSEAA